jgi:catechol 2,3-dioxygenase-like lactoylglutathione lyase family enzyme
MSHRIDQIFDAYEQGRLSRREVIGAFASFLALGSSSASASEGAPKAGAPKPGAGSTDNEADYSHLVTRREPGDGRAHLNHVNLRVADVERSHAFYQRFFGLGLVTTPTYNALDCGGGTFLSLQTKALIDLEEFRTAPEAVEWARTPDETAGTLEHFCLEVDDFDLEETAGELRAAGHEVVEVHGNLLTSDPDGILVQVVDSKIRFLHEE